MRNEGFRARLLAAVLLAGAIGLVPAARVAWATGDDAGDDTPIVEVRGLPNGLADEAQTGDQQDVVADVTPSQDPADEPDPDPEPADEPEPDPEPVDISGATVAVADQSWTGQALTPEVTVTLPDGTTLAEGTDYTVAYADNVDRGTATVTVTGTGSYTGTASATFEIGAPSFKDVTDVTAHADDIAWMAEQGLAEGWLEGDGTRTFRPLASIARADVAAFLYRLAGSPDYAAPATSPFSDVTTTTEHYKEICWLYSTGISQGWSNSNGTRSFRPLASIARADMAAFLYRLAGQPAVPDGGSSFTDVSAHTSHWREVVWLRQRGVSTGFSNGSFLPYSSVARCDMAAFLRRMSSAGLVAPGTDAAAGATAGWVRRSGSWYHLTSGAADTGQRQVTTSGLSAYFLFDSTGKMLTGLQTVGGKTFYYDSEGANVTGWQTVGGKRYYFDASAGGAMVKGTTKKIGGVPYRFDANGVCTGAVCTYPAMYTKAQHYTSRTGWLLLVDTSNCQTAIYRGSYGNWTPVKEWKCCVGKTSTPTPKGTFRVGARGYSFNSYGVTAYWYVQFYGGYYFHSEAYKLNSFEFADPVIGWPVTHGCVRLKMANAKWLYDNVPRNSTVVVY